MGRPKLKESAKIKTKTITVHKDTCYEFMKRPQKTHNQKLMVLLEAVKNVEKTI